MEIAFHSLSSINIIGEQKKLFDLFQLINDSDLIDRLFRRYVKRESNKETLNILKTKLSSYNSELLKLLVSKFENEIEHSEYFLQRFNTHIPIRLIISDMPYPLIEEEVPLEDYDNLEGDPLWMRPEYMLEKYGNK